MWTPGLGRSKGATLGRWILAIILLGFSTPAALYAEKAPDSQVATPPPSWESEIIFNGKIFCSVTRRIDLPFKGVITSVLVHSGQPVKAGDVLATYRLAPESVMAIQKRLSPPQISDMEMKLTTVERSMVPIASRQQELNRLVPKKLAPTQSLDQANRELALLKREKATLRARLQEDRQLAAQDREVLRKLLGTALKSGQVPHEVSLRSPIDGYVILVNPALRADAELTPIPGAFQVGVMNPMLVRAQAFEIEALQIKIGDLAEVTLDSLPGQKFQGKVSRVSWSSTTTNPEQPAYYEVELEVPNPNLALKEGLKARIVLNKSK
jgi:multidrug efflux pump subunit AcrA (membrane-fusion protein)